MPGRKSGLGAWALFCTRILKKDRQELHCRTHERKASATFRVPKQSSRLAAESSYPVAKRDSNMTVGHRLDATHAETGIEGIGPTRSPAFPTFLVADAAVRLREA